MSKTVRVALVGINGYGSSYLHYFLEESPVADVQLVGAIDVNLEGCPHLEALRAMDVGLYTSLEAFFAERTADLVIISSPIQWHCPQSCLAVEHGANVLCEKPVSATIQEARRMQEAAERTGKFIAIGYQWSFADAVHRLKADILDGTLGAPKLLKTLVCWPRRQGYYERNNWAGALKTPRGDWVLDSPANNATAHYLHNMLYLLGNSPATSAMPAEVVGELYRANDITNFDAAALRCLTTRGVPILFYTVHCTSEQIGPVAEYQFANGTVRIDAGTGEAAFTARFHDGTIKNYGAPNMETPMKFVNAVQAVRGEAEIRCDVAAASAHTLLINGLQESQPRPVVFPPDVVEQAGGPGDVLTYVRDIHAIWQSCFEQEKLPSELGSCPWARAGSRVDLTNYSTFPSDDFPG